MGINTRPMRNQITKEELEELSKTMSDAAIGRLYGVSDVAIMYWRRKFGIASTKHKGRRFGGNTYTIFHDYFATIDTQEKAYILGFISSDGNISKTNRTIAIELHPKDIDILEQIRTCIGSNAPIKQATVKSGFIERWESAKFTFHSSEMCRDLATYGVVPNKTFKLTYPTLPPNLERHYIRGILDGDGWISKRAFGIMSTESILQGIQNTVLRETGIELRLDKCKPKYPALIGGRKKRIVLDWLYHNSSIHLLRKFNNYLSYWS